MKNEQKGILYIVATPIGNLGDITQRALETFETVDLIAAEDTRHSGLLLSHYSIKKPFFALHDHNEQQKAAVLVEKLQQGINIAPIPGACAAITALCASGIASDRFCFEGFLPAKSKSRCDKLEALAEEPRTLIFYESTHRILETLADMQTIFGEERYIVMARELTKTWETIHGDSLGELISWLKEDSNRTKGEIVLVVEGKPETESAEFSSQAVKLLALLVAETFGYKKNALYQYGLENLGEK